jgi:hypothetical protein
MPAARLLASSPCPTCPYRRDVPSGIWDAEEYAKLPRYDEETSLQPVGVFDCHQVNGCVCSGWAACHDGEHLLALRLAEVFGTRTAGQVREILEYTTAVPVFASGREAADHGLAALHDPGARAVAAIRKIERTRAKRNGAALRA